MAEEEYPETCLLKQVPGVGPVTALYFRLVIEEGAAVSAQPGRGQLFGVSAEATRLGGEYARAADQQGGRRRGAAIVGELRALHPGGRLGRTAICGDGDCGWRRGEARTPRSGRSWRWRGKLAVLLHRLLVTGEVYEPLRNSQAAARAAAISETATGDGKQRTVAEDVLVERRVEQIRSGVAAHRRPPRQSDCDRRLGSSRPPQR